MTNHVDSDREFLRMVGSRLREARVKANLTQDEIGEMFGVTGSLVSTIETGSTSKLNVAYVNHVANLVDLPFEAFMATGNKFSIPSMVPTHVVYERIQYVHKVKAGELTYEVLTSRPVDQDGKPYGKFDYEFWIEGKLVTPPSEVRQAMMTKIMAVHRARINHSKAIHTPNIQERDDAEAQEYQPRSSEGSNIPRAVDRPFTTLSRGRYSDKDRPRA